MMSNCPHCGKPVALSKPAQSSVFSSFSMGGGVPGLGELGQFRTIRREVRKADLTSDFLFPVLVGLASFISILLILAVYSFRADSTLEALDVIFWAFSGGFWIAGATLVYNQRGRFHEESEPMEVQQQTVMPAEMAQTHTINLVMKTSNVSSSIRTGLQVPVSRETMVKVAQALRSSNSSFSGTYLNSKRKAISDYKYRQLAAFLINHEMAYKQGNKTILLVAGKRLIDSYLDENIC